MRRSSHLLLCALLGAAVSTVVVSAPAGDEDATTGAVRKIREEYAQACEAANDAYQKQIAPLVQRQQERRYRSVERAGNNAIARLQKVADGAARAGAELGKERALQAVREIRTSMEQARPAMSMSIVPRATFGGHSYLAIVAPADWDEAAKICQSMGGHLVCIETKEEMDFIRKLSRDVRLWVGATDKHKEKDWRWVNGLPVDPGLWNSRQPNNWGDEDYARLARMLHERVRVGIG